VADDVGGIISDAGALVTDVLTNVGDVLSKVLAIPTPTITVTVNPPKPTATATSTTRHTTSRPPSSPPPTSQPPTSRPPTSQPPASQPSTSPLPTSQPPASQPPASQPPASQPPASEPPASQPPPNPTSSSGQPAPTESGVEQPGGTSPGGNNPTGTGANEETGSTTGRPPSTTNTVRPNPIALPHLPDSEGDQGDDSGGSASPGTGNGGSNHGGNGNGNSNGNGNGPGNPSGGRPGGSLSGDDSDGSLGSGAITAIAIVAAILTLIVLVCLVRCYFIRRRRAKRSAWANRAAEEEKRIASWIGGPAAVTPRHSSDSGLRTIDSCHSGSTHDSSLFTGPPPVPSWSPASATQQRRILRLGNDSDSNENFGQPVDHGQFSWSGLRSPLTDMIYSPTIPASVYITNHRNTHISDDSTSLSSPVREYASQTRSSVVPSPHHSTTELSAMGVPSREQIEDSPRQSESHESDLAYARPVLPQLPGHFPTTTPTVASDPGLPTHTMAQLQSTPINIPAYMIVPSQMPTSISVSIPLPTLVPSQSRVALPPPQVAAQTSSSMWASSEGWESSVRATQSPPPLHSNTTSSPLWMAPTGWGSPAPRISSPPRSPISPVHVHPRPPVPPPVQPRTTSELFMDEDPFASPLDRADRA